MKKYKIGELLTRIKDVVLVEDDKEYKRITIKSKNQGVFLRDIVQGSNIGTKRQFLAKEGQFIMSRIDARNGAFGIIPSELEGAIMTNDFLTFEVNADLINIDYFNILTASEKFINYCVYGSKGTTNRKRLKEDIFLNFEIELPTLDEQIKTVESYKNKKNKYEDLLKEINKQEIYIENLRYTILELAVKGKLVSQDVNDEPASILLEKIKREKEKLIKDKKIKKENLLPKITEAEIPYEIPAGWEWVRIGEITTIRGGKRIPSGSKIQTEPTEHIYIRITDMKNGTIEDNDLRYIDDKTYEKIKNYIITSDDIYITIAGTIAQVGIVPLKFNNMNLTENAARITPHIINKIWLKFFFESSIVKNTLLDKVNQVAQPKLALTRIKNTLIPLPPLNEQKRIVKKINSLMALCDELEKEINNSKQLNEMLMVKILEEEISK